MRQPKALPLLSFVKMWQFFSHYGNRALLVLYMVGELGFSDSRAYAVYAVYCSLVELGGLGGGWIADRWLGLKRTCLVGSGLIAAGHLILPFEGSLFLGLAFIAVGTGLFATNISALLGQFYENNDPRRERGFTLFYMGMNGGAFIATLACGFAAERLGWHAGFGLAAAGMVLGSGGLLLSLPMLRGKGDPTGKVSYLPALIAVAAALPAVCLALEHASAALPLLPAAVLLALATLFFRLPTKEIAVALTALILFFSAEEQIGSSLLLFMEKMGTKQCLGIPLLPVTALAINPLVIICLGGAATAAGARLRRHRLPTAFVLAATGFALVALSPLVGPPFPLEIALLTMLLISCAELLIGPHLFARCSASAPKGREGVAMAFLPLGFSMASLAGGALSGLVAQGGAEPSLELYGKGFGTITLLLAAAAALFWIPPLLAGSKKNDLPQTG